MARPKRDWMRAIAALGLHLAAAASATTLVRGRIGRDGAVTVERIRPR